MAVRVAGLGRGGASCWGGGVAVGGVEWVWFRVGGRGWASMSGRCVGGACWLLCAAA